jgi:hypothetical protein
VPGEVVRVNDLWQFRVVNDFPLDQRGPWALQVLALHQQLENGAASNSRIHWVSLGARPVRRLGHFFSLATEAGYTAQGDLPGGLPPLTAIDSPASAINCSHSAPTTYAMSACACCRP